MKFATAVVGCVLTVLIVFYLWYTGFGTRHRYDIIVNLHWARPNEEMPLLSRLLQRHSRSIHCASRRSGDRQEGMDLSYRLLLRDPARLDAILDALRQAGLK